MKTKKITGRFWTVLTSLNLLALLYPYRSLIQADSYDGRYVAALVYFGALFFLAIIDGVAVKLT